MVKAFDLLEQFDNRRTGNIFGVVVAIVIDNYDPEGRGRVKVKFPQIASIEDGQWARIATLMAGESRGSFFLPEINDEVLVAFERGDITRPFVLGALWNGVDVPPYDNADKENNLRFIKSRSGHLIRLDDKEGAEKIEIIDKSGNNSVIIDTASNTITITSDADVKIEAPKGTIKLNAQNIEIASSAETKVAAQGGLNLDGSPGTTTIKGATVNIN